MKIKPVSTCGNEQKGVVLVLVMAFMSLMVLSSVSLSLMIQRDVKLIERIKDKEQAQYVAEAGISEAFARVKDSGFASHSNFTGSLDTGTYSVAYTTVGSRYLITSTGTVGNVSSTVSAEIEDKTPTALLCFSGAGNDIKIKSLVSIALINGNVHANHDVNLYATWLTLSYLRITGKVSATNIVLEGTKYHSGGSIFTDPFDDLCVINGVANDGATVYEYATRITFPTFNLEEYKRLAQESGDYYSSSQTFTNKTFTPTSGIVYIDGDATFKGVCTINGGIIANNILVINTLEQNVSGTRNVIMATTGNIKIFGRLYTEKALVYAAQDILSVQALAIIDINGIMLAGRNIDMWDLITFITYDYVFVAPSDMLDENGEQPFGLVSWNS